MNTNRNLAGAHGVATRRRTLAELEAQPGIKAQHAAAAFIIGFLNKLDNGWTGQETQVGGSEDRQGIDFWLINEREGKKILVDFSFASKGGFAVKLEHDWFEENEDGSYRFLDQYSQLLFRRFLPAMNSNFHVSIGARV